MKNIADNVHLENPVQIAMKELIFIMDIVLKFVQMDFIQIMANVWNVKILALNAQMDQFILVLLVSLNSISSIIDVFNNVLMVISEMNNLHLVDSVVKTARNVIIILIVLIAVVEQLWVNQDFVFNLQIVVRLGTTVKFVMIVIVLNASIISIFKTDNVFNYVKDLHIKMIKQENVKIAHPTVSSVNLLLSV